MTPRTLHEAADLDPALIDAVAEGQAIRLAPGVLAVLEQSCAQARELLRRGDQVYGVTTGMGALSGVRLSAAEQLRHQQNLLLARATGGPPWLGAADVRAIIAVRLRTFLSGDAGVSAALCQRLVDILHAGIVPAVPRTGVGTAGEIMPLAHMFGPLAGLGRVLAPADREPAGLATRPAAEALAERGLGAYRLGPKEGIALLAGVPGATALALRRLAEARILASQMETAAALAIAAVRASRDPYRAACARVTTCTARCSPGSGRPSATWPSPRPCRRRCRSGWPVRCSPRCTGPAPAWPRRRSAGWTG